MEDKREIDMLLIEAAKEGNLGAVKFLVEKGSNVNAKDTYGGTALMVATYRGHLDIVKFLAEKGSDVNVKTDRGETALIWAAEGGGAFRHRKVSDRKRCRREGEDRIWHDGTRWGQNKWLFKHRKISLRARRERVEC